MSAIKTRYFIFKSPFFYEFNASCKARANWSGQEVDLKPQVMPEIILPEGYDVSTLNVTQSGVVSVKVNGANDPVEVGQLELYRFPNAVGLQAEGDNLFIVTNASGDAIAGRPGYEGFGDVRHKFLEMSNVSVVNEMVQMITAQRAYEFNSKTIQTSDNMLSTAVNLKR